MKLLENELEENLYEAFKILLEYYENDRLALRRDEIDAFERYIEEYEKQEGKAHKHD